MTVPNAISTDLPIPQVYNPRPLYQPPPTAQLYRPITSYSPVSPIRPDPGPSSFHFAQPAPHTFVPQPPHSFPPFPPTIRPHPSATATAAPQPPPLPKQQCRHPRDGPIDCIYEYEVVIPKEYRGNEHYSKWRDHEWCSASRCRHNDDGIPLRTVKCSRKDDRTLTVRVSPLHRQNPHTWPSRMFSHHVDVPYPPQWANAEDRMNGHDGVKAWAKEQLRQMDRFDDQGRSTRYLTTRWEADALRIMWREKGPMKEVEKPQPSSSGTGRPEKPQALSSASVPQKRPIAEVETVTSQSVHEVPLDAVEERPTKFWKAAEHGGESEAYGEGETGEVPAEESGQEAEAQDVGAEEDERDVAEDESDDSEHDSIAEAVAEAFEDMATEEFARSASVGADGLECDDQQMEEEPEYAQSVGGVEGNAEGRNRDEFADPGSPLSIILDTHVHSAGAGSLVDDRVNRSLDGPSTPPRAPTSERRPSPEASEVLELTPPPPSPPPSPPTSHASEKSYQRQELAELAISHLSFCPPSLPERFFLSTPGTLSPMSPAASDDSELTPHPPSICSPRRSPTPAFARRLAPRLTPRPTPELSCQHSGADYFEPKQECAANDAPAAPAVPAGLSDPATPLVTVQSLQEKIEDLRDQSRVWYEDYICAGIFPHLSPVYQRHIDRWDGEIKVLEAQILELSR
ncbi:hypothetical protein IAT38_007422 [Cryptococcus sp. DSM 104549]